MRPSSRILTEVPRQKCPDDVMKDIVKLACKGTKDAALTDLCKWLLSTLEKGTFKVRKCTRMARTTSPRACDFT